MSNDLKLLPRQRQIVSFFLNRQQKYIQLDDIANELSVSPRTIQRDLKELKDVFGKYHLKVKRKKNQGLSIEGLDLNKEKLSNDLYFNAEEVFFTLNERQLALKFELLSLKKPVKIYQLSNTYGVSEGTISRDLDEFEPVFQNYQIDLVRRPGFGLEVVGNELDIRRALVNEFKKQLSVEGWLNILEFPQKAKDQSVFHALLFKDFQFDRVISLDKMLRSIIQKNVTLFSDLDYVNLLIELMVMMKRIGEGSIISNEEGELEEIEVDRLTNEIIGILKFNFQTYVPQIEAWFLSSLLKSPTSKIEDRLKENITLTEEHILDFLITVGHLLNVSFLEDSTLITGLTRHLNSFIRRSKQSGFVYIPLNEKIKSENEKYFKACFKCKHLLEKELMRTLPDEELTYVSFYLAASVIRKETSKKVMTKAIVVCSSGIGTGHFLASRINQEFNNIDIIDIVSMINLKKTLEEYPSVNLVISTVNLSFVDGNKMVKVSPLLQEEDIEVLKQKLAHLSTTGKISYSKRDEIEKKSDRDSLLSICRYGEALLQIERNFKMKYISEFSFDLILNPADFNSILKDREKLILELKKREEKGPFVYQGILLLHTRSTDIEELLVRIYRLDKEESYKTKIGQCETIHTILLIVSPDFVTEEYLNTISQISARLIDETVWKIFSMGNEGEIKEKILEILTDFIRIKISEFSMGS